MNINVKNKEDKEFLSSFLWLIGVDIHNKVHINITKNVEYDNIYFYMFNIIPKIQPYHMFKQNLFLVTELSPSNNHYLQRGRWGNSYTPKTTRDFQKKLSLMTKDISSDWKIPHENKYIDTNFTFWFDRDDRDANNYFKVNLDILEDHIYKNDKRTIPITNNVFIGADKQLIEVSMSKKIGVFDSLYHLQDFVKENCLKCKRATYKRKCSDFFKMLENRLGHGYKHLGKTCNKKTL